MRDPILFAKALADATRWRIVCLVSERALCVCELADVLGLPQSTLSSHLRVIVAADLLDCERREKWLYYRVKEEMRPLMAVLFQHFSGHCDIEPTLARDAKKASLRVSRREVECCPAPVRLRSVSSKSKRPTP